MPRGVHIIYKDIKKECTMKESKAIGIRLRTEDLEEIKKRADRKGWSFNKWMNWAVGLGLRSHRKKVDEQD